MWNVSCIKKDPGTFKYCCLGIACMCSTLFISKVYIRCKIFLVIFLWQVLIIVINPKNLILNPPVTLLGSLCLKDSMENVETAVGLINKTTVLYMHFLGHFFTLPLRSLHEISLCDVFWWTKKSRQQILFFFFLNLSAVPTFGILSGLERTRQRWKKWKFSLLSLSSMLKLPFVRIQHR